MEVAFPFISPDGKQVSFGTVRGALYVVMDGGSPREIVKKGSCCGAWSPDGNILIILHR